ncbi:hypothetical protein [Clostridium algidicarnis]|uniref:Uncharacterized protein n=1 Tax=Clostridium algidicarnis DSM 15099 TaxID=1121295 RepID=A0A2S6FUU0_9CLOT|nr:hypothetical protein [Clostridium algidicarnis]MBU3210681.1 hypothetical protein [Clostridium algidicarnis]MBU3229132.1 hypothetical protein [Clostridium algidicarnis]MBU3252635.1 hypothetical protein [Clostridium algidicarnis]PPK43897.1 hypothetical protein BD821_12612 [Clostridium algidicarnis DSM 15099]
MRKDELKSVIGENCPGYEPRYGLSLMSMGGHLSPSCDNCSNFVRGKCFKGLYDPIKNMINNN